MAKLSDRAILAQLSISVWTARRYDKRVSKATTDANNADASAGRFNKHLLPMSTALDDVQSAAREIRRFFYENTLPWGTEGIQLLPTANYLDFMASIREKKEAWHHLVTVFLREYEQLVADAPRFLGNMFDPADYPPADQIGRKFNINLELMPVPAFDFRTDVPEQDLEEIRRGVEARVIEAQATAMREVWDRLHNVIQKAHEKLADPNAIFRDSLVENIREVCNMLPKLNIMDDPDLENLRLQALIQLTPYGPDALRSDPVLRSDRAAEAKRLLDTMNSIMGV